MSRWHIFSKKSAPQSTPVQLSLSDEDIQKISKAVTEAILEAEAQKNKATPCEKRKLTIGEGFRVFFTPVKKMRTENSAISLTKFFVSIICRIVSWLGYAVSICLLVSGCIYAFQQQWFYAIITALLAFLISALIWLVARLFAAAYVEIGDSNNPDLIFGFSAFLLAGFAIIISFIGKGA